MPRVAIWVLSEEGLTGRYVVAARDEFKHVLVHLDELVLRERLLLLSLNEGFLDLFLEEAGLDRVDDLRIES